jgi:SnoaL-like domain
MFQYLKNVIVAAALLQIAAFGAGALTFDNSPRAPNRIEGSLRRQAMSYSNSTLILRNLRDVFGENDPARRRAAIDELYNEDGVFYDPNSGAHRGRDEIDRIAGVIKATHPDFQYRPIAAPEELGDGARVKWVSGSPGKKPAYAGTDFLIARNGRIAAVYLFFDGPSDPTRQNGPSD